MGDGHFALKFTNGFGATYFDDGSSVGYNLTRDPECAFPFESMQQVQERLRELREKSASNIYGSGVIIPHPRDHHE